MILIVNLHYFPQKIKKLCTVCFAQLQQQTTELSTHLPLAILKTKAKASNNGYLTESQSSIYNHRK